MFDDSTNSNIEVLCRNGLGQKLIYAGVPGGKNTLFLRMAGNHDDGGKRVGPCLAVTNKAGQFKPVYCRHLQVGNDDVRIKMLEYFQGFLAVIGMLDFTHPQRLEHH